MPPEAFRRLPRAVELFRAAFGRLGYRARAVSVQQLREIGRGKQRGRTRSPLLRQHRRYLFRVERRERPLVFLPPYLGLRLRHDRRGGIDVELKSRFPDHLHREGVDRRNVRVIHRIYRGLKVSELLRKRRTPFDERIFYAVAHFAGRLLRKGQHEYLAGAAFGVGGEQPSEALSERLSLSRSGSGAHDREVLVALERVYLRLRAIYQRMPRGGAIFSTHRSPPPLPSLNTTADRACGRE